MSVNLQKGQRVSLSKDREGLSKIMVGLGWDAAEVKKHGLFGFGGGSTHNIDCEERTPGIQQGCCIFWKSEACIRRGQTHGR